MSNNPLSDSNVPLKSNACIESDRDGEFSNGKISFWRRLRRIFWHVAARQLTLLFLISVKVVSWFGRKRHTIDDRPLEIMLTGRFDSKNWILAHLVPLAQSKHCACIYMVSTNPVPEIPNVKAIYPHKWLIKCFGATPARLLTFLWAAICKRPHFVGGFHIMVNGIMAILVGLLIGARSIYFCVGGPEEVRDGGIHSGDSYFRKMDTPDAIVERRFLRLIANFDMIITMGSRAVTFFRNRGIDTVYHIVSGGIDSKRFQSNQKIRLYDCIMTGRLVDVKRIDIFLRAIKIVVAEIPDVRVVIIGDGKLRSKLQQLSCSLEIEHNVIFEGYKDDIENWLQKSKIFVLTSDSEGLSLSMMEAMMCGLPVVVSDVGDLADLVEDGINGYLVPRRTPNLFAMRLIELLKNSHKLESFSNAAYKSTLRYDIQTTVLRWNKIFAERSKL